MQSKHRHNSAMSRRNTPAMKALVMAGIMAFLVFMIYSYHKSNTELARKTKFVEKLTQEHDSLSAQLQVVYEHKSRLETQLKDEEKKNKDMAKDFQSQLKSAETNYLQEKEALQERISSINQQNKLLEGRKDELEQEYGKLQSDYDKVLQDSRMGMEENLKEFQQAKQQCENDIARLRDDIANLERRNDVLTEQVKGAQNANVEAQQQLQQQQQNIAQAQQQQQNNAQAQQQQQNNIAAQQKNLPAQPNGLAQQNNVAGLQQNNGQDNNGFPQQNNALAQENKVPFQANNAFGQQQQNNVGQENNVPMQQNKVLGEQNNVAADNNVLHFQPGQQNEIKQENEAVAPVDLNMQINKPGDQPAYFKPKLLPEHVEEGADDVVARAVNGDDNADHENPAQQVVPPQIDAKKAVASNNLLPPQADVMAAAEGGGVKAEQPDSKSARLEEDQRQESEAAVRVFGQQPPLVVSARQGKQKEQPDSGIQRKQKEQPEHGIQGEQKEQPDVALLQRADNIDIDKNGEDEEEEEVDDLSRKIVAADNLNPPQVVDGNVPLVEQPDGIQAAVPINGQHPAIDEEEDEDRGEEDEEEGKEDDYDVEVIKGGGIIGGERNVDVEDDNVERNQHRDF